MNKIYCNYGCLSIFARYKNKLVSLLLISLLRGASTGFFKDLCAGGDWSVKERNYANVHMETIKFSNRMLRVRCTRNCFTQSYKQGKVFTT